MLLPFIPLACVVSIAVYALVIPPYAVDCKKLTPVSNHPMKSCCRGNSCHARRKVIRSSLGSKLPSFTISVCKCPPCVSGSKRKTQDIIVFVCYSMRRSICRSFGSHEKTRHKTLCAKAPPRPTPDETRGRGLIKWRAWCQDIEIALNNPSIS